MFKLMKDRVVKWPVTVQVPIDGGQFEERTFNARFKLLGTEELAGLDADKLISTIMVGWTDVYAEDESPIAFSEAALAELADIGYVRRAVLAAYGEALAGAKRKN